MPIISGASPIFVRCKLLLHWVVLWFGMATYIYNNAVLFKSPSQPWQWAMPLKLNQQHGIETLFLFLSAHHAKFKFTAQNRQICWACSHIAEYCLSFARGIYIFMWISPRQWRWAILQSVSIVSYVVREYCLSGRYITAVTALCCGQNFLEAADLSVLLPWMRQGSYELKKFSYIKK